MASASKTDLKASSEESSIGCDLQYLTIKQASKQYPALFSPAPLKPAVGKAIHSPTYWCRPRTGIAVQLIQHGQLTPEQFEAIGEYRLEQYVLAGLYDGKRVTELGLTTDPTLVGALDSTLHLVIGDTEHHILCYVSFELAHISAPLEAMPKSLSSQASGTPVHPWMCHRNRLLFPVEVDYGHQLYASHPGVALLPVATVREMTRLVRNQAIRGPYSTLATTEVIVATSQILRTEKNYIEAIIGCASPDVRRLLNRFNIPMAYAPDAVDRLGESPASLDAAIWSPEAHKPGKFWPIALAATDVRAESVYYDSLNAALDADPGHILEACQQALLHSQHTTPRYCYMPATVQETEHCKSTDQQRSFRWVAYFDPKATRESTLTLGTHVEQSMNGSAPDGVLYLDHRAAQYPAV